MTDVVVTTEDEISVVSEGIQGPAGPPGPGAIENIIALPFIGSGLGAAKTTTGTNNNVIFEQFGIGDELYTYWAFPTDLDKTVDPTLEGSMFLLTDQIGKLTSWEIHITAHDHVTGLNVYTGVLYATDLPMPETGYQQLEASAIIPASVYLLANVQALHIKLVRVASSNDPVGDVGVSDMGMRFSRT